MNTTDQVMIKGRGEKPESLVGIRPQREQALLSAQILLHPKQAPAPLRERSHEKFKPQTRRGHDPPG